MAESGEGELAAAGALTDAETTVGLRYALRQGLAGHVMGTLAGGIFLTKVVLELGGSVAVIGLLAALPALAQLASIPATYLVERYRDRKRVALYSLGGVRVCLLGIAAVPLLVAPAPGLALLLVLVFLQGVFGAAGNSAWNSLLRDLVPQERMGAFFSRRQRLSLLLGVPASLGAAAFVGVWTRRAPAREFEAYALLFVAGVGVGLVGLYFLSRTPEPRMPHASGPPDIVGLMARPFRDANFRRLMAFLGSWNVAIALSGPFFTVYLLQRLGYGIPTVIALTVLSQLANAAFAPVWGRVGDSFSNKAVLAVSGPLVLVGTALWLFTAMPTRYWLTMPLLVVIHVLLGISMSGVTLATGTVGMKLAPRGRATSYLAATSLVGSVASGVGPLVGGAVAAAFADRRLTLSLQWDAPGGTTSVPAFTVTGIDFAFLLALAVGVYAMHRLSLVVEAGVVDRPAVVQELFAEVRRPFLSFTTVGGFAGLVASPVGLLRENGRNRRPDAREEHDEIAPAGADDRPADDPPAESEG